jgi:FAD/FMN-containing dehydrogenase
MERDIRFWEGGYNLLPGNCRWPTQSLVQLLVGSEGTLCVLSSATLKVVPRAKHRGLLVPHFDSLASALNALSACLEFQPSAVELMDSMLIRLAREQRSLRNTMDAIEGTPAALFMVEFADDDAAEVSSRVHGLKRRLREVPGVTASRRNPTFDRFEPIRRAFALWLERSAQAGRLRRVMQIEPARARVCREISGDSQATRTAGLLWPRASVVAHPTRLESEGPKM